MGAPTQTFATGGHYFSKRCSFHSCWSCRETVDAKIEERREKERRWEELRWDEGKDRGERRRREERRGEQDYERDETGEKIFILEF